MTRGRKPTPTRTKQLRGNPGKRKINRAEPQFEAEMPTPPDHLNADALAEWNEISMELLNKMVITKIDKGILTLYCSTWSELRELEKQALDTERYIEMINKNGQSYIARHPIFTDIGRLRKELQSYAAELGITPSSRSKVKVVGSRGEKQTKRNDELAAKLFKRTVDVNP